MHLATAARWRRDDARPMADMTRRCLLVLCLGFAGVLAACGGDEPIRTEPLHGDACVNEVTVDKDDDGVGHVRVSWNLSSDEPVKIVTCWPGRNGSSVGLANGPMDADTCHANGERGNAVTAWDLRQGAEAGERVARCVPWKWHWGYTILVVVVIVMGSLAVRSIF